MLKRKKKKGPRNPYTAFRGRLKKVPKALDLMKKKKKNK